MTELTIHKDLAGDAIVFILNATSGERAGELRITGASLDQLYAIADRIYEANPELKRPKK